MNSSESLQLWLSEVESEIAFWDRLFATKGREGGDPDIFKFKTDSNCPFQIPEDLESDNSKVLDVGSGPYSRLGYIHNGKKVDLTLIDPLAFAYRELGKKYGYNFAVSPRTGMVECLNLILPENYYNLVHMSNALDHSYDPIEGINQLLYVTKVGGKVILRHHNNVAEVANYQGLHQWNLTTDNNHFIIWNRENKVVMDDLIKDYTTIEFAAPSEETTLGSTWKYNKIVIRKNKSFELKPTYTGDVLIQLCEHVMQRNLEAYENEKMSKLQRVLKALKR